MSTPPVTALIATLASPARPTQHTRAARPAPAILAVLALAALSTALLGCYERTISSRGPGSVKDSIEKPYQSDSWIDRQLFGPVEPEKK